MRYTVLGSSGFIGSRLVRHLRDKGEEVFAPQRGDQRIFREDLGRVVYAIGMTADFREKPLETAEAHVGFLTRLLREGNFSSLLYLSSTRVYQGSPRGGEQTSLSVFPDLNGLYNLTKLTGESLCLQSRGGRVARLSNVVGEGASESFVAQLLREASKGAIRLRTSPASCKDYVVVDDAVKALAALADAEVGGIFNVASGKNTSTREILDAISTIMKYELELEQGGPSFSFPVIETRLLSKVLDWRPQDVTQWIKEMPRCR